MGKEEIFLTCGILLILLGAWLIHTGISIEISKGRKAYIMAGFCVMACMVIAVINFACGYQ